MSATALAAGVFPPARIAVSALFFMNGFMVGSWAPKIPEFAARFALSESALGIVILVFGIGSLIAMPIVGAGISRIGAARIMRLMALVLALSLLAITISPTLAIAAIAVLGFGAAVGGMDVAMNANAVVVERDMRRAIMSSCHGFWSLGGLVGAAAGGVLIAALGSLGHAVVATMVSAGIVFAVWRMARIDGPAPDEAKPPLRLPKMALPYLLGTMALFSMVPEGAVLDWGALFLRQERGADLALSGLAFGAFSATMALMRFLGDAVRDRLGAVTTMRLSATIAMVGMAIAGFAPGSTAVIVGFAIAGIGIANLVPIAFSAAGNAPNLPPGIGLTVVTTMGYSGILLAPSVIGWIAEHTGFAPIFAAMPLLLGAVLAASPLAATANVTD